jgi:hypothetical protein
MTDPKSHTYEDIDGTRVEPPARPAPQDLTDYDGLPPAEPAPPAPVRAPARITGGKMLGLLDGALYELTTHPGLALEKLAYLALAVTPNLDRELLASVCGRTVPTVAGYEERLAELGLLDPDTRTVLYPRTGTVQ